MEAIKQYFNKSGFLREDDWQYFLSKLTRKEYGKKDMLTRCGEVENKLSFLEKGVARYFFIKGEAELTFAFAFENNFVSAYDSFLARVPAFYYIEILKPAIVWSINFFDLQEIYSSTKIGNLIGRKAAEELFLKKSKREISLLTQTASERYLHLLTEQPALLQQIPLKYIASYIGVTPQALSRIRKQIY